LVLAHNSVDRELMARDSIELTQYDDVVSTPRARTNRSANSELKLGASAYSRTLTEDDIDGEPRSRQSGGGKSRSRAAGARNEGGRNESGVRNEDDSELLIHPEDMNLDEMDGDEAQFLRTNKRVPVRRSPIPKKAASQIKIALIVVTVVLICAGLWGWAYSYGMHSWRFRIDSSDAVEIDGVQNASRAQVMEVAGQDIGRNIFFVPLDERQRQMEQIPWVEHASVKRLLPNRLSFSIEERTPVAFAQIGPRTSLIDAGGVVMGMPANRQTKYSFPVIRGIAETEPLSSRAAAMKIYNRLISELGSGEGQSGAAGSKSYVNQLSEVDLSDPENVKVTANDAGGTMVVHLGSEDFLPRYKLYVTHIAEWRQQFQNVQSVDLRYEGQVIVNPDKPAASGKPLPLINTDNTDLKKPVLKTVSAKPAAASSQPAVAKTAVTNTKPAVARPAVKPAAKPVAKTVVKKATSKTVAKKAAGKPASKKAVAKKQPQKTQTAQK
jgi:cell division protein FtsQ